MKRLSQHAYTNVINYLETEVRPLEQAIFEKSPSKIIQALGQFQNEDGGFGHGIEPDIQLPASSPLATSVALQTLVTIDQRPDARSMIKKAIRYLEMVFVSDRPGWISVPPDVNDYPHAFWWTVHENGETWIDASWGNPSAELIGYVRRYEDMVESLDVPSLVDHMLTYFLRLEEFESEHEIYCFLRFFEMHPDLYNEQVEKQMKRAVEAKVVAEQEKWTEYVPFPLKFKPSPECLATGLQDKDLQANLDYFVEQLEESPVISPPWEWNDYPADWEKAKHDWQGILTLEALQYLQNYGRV